MVCPVFWAAQSKSRIATGYYFVFQDLQPQAEESIRPVEQHRHGCEQVGQEVTPADMRQLVNDDGV